MEGLSKHARQDMLQTLLTRVNGSNIYFALLSRSHQVDSYPVDSQYWEEWDGTPGSTLEQVTVAMDATGDVPFLYNTTALEFEEDASTYPGVGYIAIMEDTGAGYKYVLLQPLVERHEWDGHPYVIPAGGFRIYI